MTWFLCKRTKHIVEHIGVFRTIAFSIIKVSETNINSVLLEGSVI